MWNLRATLLPVCVSVVVFVSVAALLKDPLSAQPCSPLWACICGADQRRLWKRRDQGSESPPSEQPRLVHFPVSPPSPWSFQPAHQQPQSQGASIQGEGRCLEDRVGHGAVSSAPPPTCLTAALPSATFCFLPVHVCVWFFFFFLSFSCNYALLPSTLGCVWNPTHTSLLMPLVAPRCWSSERAKYRERQRERGGVWWAKRDDGSREYCFSPPVPSINIILIMKSLAEVELMSHFYICASLRARHARAHMFLWVLRMLMKALNCFLQMNTNTHHTHTHVRAQQSNKQQQKISSGDQ